MGRKRVKLEGKEDRISTLPDSIIHHILSFLPSTKQVIQTSVLSKQWQNQWTRVPVLIFDSTAGMSYQNFLKFIDNTLILHECSKIKKFHLQYPCHDEKDPQFDAKILFATRKYVEELNLMSSITQGSYVLPKFLFNNASLVKLRTDKCSFMPNGKVNWGCLTTLIMNDCRLPDQALEQILSGSPLLKSLELFCSLSEKIIIVSKSLKRLCLFNYYSVLFKFVEISCPNLEELSLMGMYTDGSVSLPQVIENVLSSSSLLESFELFFCDVRQQLVIASKSLKRLVVGNIGSDFEIEISCPKLEKLKLLDGLNVKTVKLLDLPSSLCGTIDFFQNGKVKNRNSFIKDVLLQLQHVKELRFGSWFIRILSSIKVGGRFSPLLNIKYLTLNYPQLLTHHYGMACLLRMSPVLEKLVINMKHCDEDNRKINWEYDYWDSNTTFFNCLVSHLKTIEIIGFPEKDLKRKRVLIFVQFLLKNARVLEKMVVTVKDDGKGFPLEVSQELLSLPRCSPNVIIELLCSNEIGKFL